MGIRTKQLKELEILNISVVITEAQYITELLHSFKHDSPKGHHLSHVSGQGLVLRVVQIHVALLMWMEAESERVELNTGVGFGWGACGGMSMDVRIRLRVDKHAGGP